MPSFKIFLGGLFALLVISISVLAVFTYNLNEATTETWKWVHHSREVLDQIDEIASDFKAVQLESNAIFLKADSGLVQRYALAKNSMMNGISNLKLLTQDNSRQKEKVLRIDTSLQTLMQFTDSVIIKPAPFTNTALLRRIEINNDFQRTIQDRLDAIKEVEKRILLERQSRNSINRETFNSVLVAMLVGVFTLIGSTFILVRHNFNKLLSTEHRLKQANELFFHLFDDSPVAMVMCQPNGPITHCNHQFLTLAKYTRQEAVGKTITELGLYDNRQKNEFPVLDDTEFEMTPKNSPPVWISSSTRPIHLKDRDCILTTLVDITSRKQAEEEVRKSLSKEIELNKLKSNFVTLASHEFRTPLTTILSSTTLVDNYIPDVNKEKVSKHLSRIRGAVTNLTTILDEFLSLTKIEEGRVSPKNEKVDVQELITSIVKSIKGSARLNQVIRTTHIGKAMVKGDAAILTQIITNLLSNAIKYSPESGEIAIASETNTELIIRVSDSGIGIPVEDQPHLFERFFRASNSGSVPGTGLGLHLTKQYVELLGGSISFVSAPGTGTTFMITLPFY